MNPCVKVWKDHKIKKKKKKKGSVFYITKNRGRI